MKKILKIKTLIKQSTGEYNSDKLVKNDVKTY